MQFRFKISFVFLYIFSFQFCLSHCASDLKEGASGLAKEPVVRVLIAFCDQNEEAASLSFETSSGVMLVDVQDTQRHVLLDQSKLDVSIQSGSLFINQKKLIRSHVLIRPSANTFKFNGVLYSGALLCVQENGRVYVINCVGLEDYVAGVLSAETWPGWPLEANKVLAIAIRTYVASMVDESHRIKRLYHVKNTNSHQVYRGMCLSDKLKKAVLETRGQVVVDAKNKMPILAMYDTCCGGIIPAHVRGIDFQKAPYLARKKACTFCAKSKRYTWSVTYDKNTLCSSLKILFPHLKQLREIRVHTRDRAGLVTSVAIKESHGIHTVSGKRLCSLLKGVKSCCFSISTHGRRVIFKGRGQGHQMGLCQWGSFHMVQSDWSLERILKFYYPGTEIRELAYALVSSNEGE